MKCGLYEKLVSRLETAVYYHEHKIIHDGVQVAVTVTMTLTNMVALLYISFNILGKHGLC